MGVVVGLSIVGAGDGVRFSILVGVLTQVHNTESWLYLNLTGTWEYLGQVSRDGALVADSGYRQEQYHSCWAFLWGL